MTNLKELLIILANQKLEVEEKMVAAQIEIEGLEKAGCDKEVIEITIRESENAFLEMKTIEESMHRVGGFKESCEALQEAINQKN